jgi:predicted O-methyltransferase YrrM
VTALPRIFTSVHEDEASALVEYAADNCVLEIGSWVGFSAVAMARVAREVHAVDWHQGDDDAGRQNTLPQLWKNLARYGVRDKVILHVGRSERVLPLFAPDIFDFVFIDGAHTTEQVRLDAWLTLPLVRHGGRIAFHDYEDERFGVTAAVRQLIAEDERVEWEGNVRTLAVLRRL